MASEAPEAANQLRATTFIAHPKISMIFVFRFQKQAGASRIS
jgi:hypothetical protein